MFREIFRDITDTLDVNKWTVHWINDDGVSYFKEFHYKHDARTFYKNLPYYHKRMERE